MQSTASMTRDLMDRLEVVPADVLDAVVEASQDALDPLSRQAQRG